MVQTFICPECRSEHAEPAEAHFLLAVLCVDCAMAIEFHASRVEIVEMVAEAA
jgi:hypothetical protein